MYTYILFANHINIKYMNIYIMLWTIKYNITLVRWWINISSKYPLILFEMSTCDIKYSYGYKWSSTCKFISSY